MSQITLEGDCLEVLKDLPDNSIDAIVTDPPYGLAFMGKKWDYDVPSKDIWIECLRVLKPGGHLLSFGGTRTYHRMAVAIEDAGFEIRDQIQWLYGSGFPKSHNIKEGEFKGWGTALKPANEPICMARKPLIGTVAKNFEKYGTGGLNIDANRIETDGRPHIESKSEKSQHVFGDGLNGSRQVGTFTQGRWPANVIFDEEAAQMLDEQSGVSKSQSGGRSGSNANLMSWTEENKDRARGGHADSGGASRFFYIAKASKRERTEGNTHPTVKPVKLMEYLIKLVTPPGGVVLDPFMGSGTTGVAAKALGFDFIGIERDAEYIKIAEKRIESA